MTIPRILTGSLIALIISLPLSATLAQTDSFFVSNKWCSRKDTLLLFNGGYNIIQIYNPTQKPANYKLKVLDKSLRIGTPELIGDTLTIMAMPYPSKDKQMRLAILNAKTSKIIKTLYWSSDSIPKPLARLGNIQTDEAYKKTILSQNKLSVYFPKSLYAYPYTIKQFTLKAKTPAKEVNLTANNFLLPMGILKEINEAPDGTWLEFTNIKAACPECSLRDVGDLKIKIKPAVVDTSARARTNH